MSTPFSHAYVSAMVRAGEGLGHGELFEVVQNEDVSVSTMIPFDIFADPHTGEWEDPCRPVEGFNQGLSGDDLMRKAHARAMIQRSLKKLQDRHNIKGGTPVSGPYAESDSSPSGSGSVGNVDSGGKSGAGSNTATTPRGFFRRRSFSEPPVQPGTGSSPATSWSLYDPRHSSAPLLWKSDGVENTPYGRYQKNSRPRSLSLSQVGLRQAEATPKKAGRSMSVASFESAKSEDSEDIPRSTQEINWTELAGIFQRVSLPGTEKAQREKEKAIAAAPNGNLTIFAPFVHKIETISTVASDEESDEEEDLSDGAVLARHQIVLDGMKEKLSAIFDARKKQQDRKKGRMPNK
jgi:hypothetical protein